MRRPRSYTPRHHGGARQNIYRSSKVELEIPSNNDAHSSRKPQPEHETSIPNLNWSQVGVIFYTYIKFTSRTPAAHKNIASAKDGEEDVNHKG